MARPSSTPRLRDIDPVAFGEEVVRLVTDHAVSLLMQIDPSATWSIPHGILLQSEARMLAMYAHRGLIGDWTNHGNAADAYVSLCNALFTQAGRPHEIGDVPDDDLDPTDPIGIVLLAAKGRIRIDRRERVHVRELACLAGVDPDHVRLLGRKGEIEIEDGEVRAAECRRWLGARGVDGL